MNPFAPIYLPFNHKGGSRTSYSMAMVYLALKEIGHDPLAVALDTSSVFADLIQAEDFLHWDLSHTEESTRQFDAVLKLSRSSGRPLVIDLPPGAHRTRGLHQFWPLAKDQPIVGIVPTLDDPATAEGAIQALRGLHHQAWIHFDYQTGFKPSLNNNEHEALAFWEPTAVISPPELSWLDALRLRDGTPLPQRMNNHNDHAYWSQLLTPLGIALYKAQLPEPTPAC